MGRLRIAPFLLAGAALASPVLAHPQGLPETAGVPGRGPSRSDGQPAPLYPAPDGSGRYYVEARQGCRYAVTLANRTAERVGVVLTVDGLNAISGQRDEGRGRMYVLDPWQRTTVQGWRTSLQEVRQFTFVDERASYAARTGKANEKMGWIEIAVYRERRRSVVGGLARGAHGGPLPPRARHGPGNDGRPKPARDSAEAAAPAPSRRAPARSYPGTGWGPAPRTPSPS